MAACEGKESSLTALSSIWYSISLICSRTFHRDGDGRAKETIGPGSTKLFLNQVRVDDIFECWIGKQQESKNLGG